MVSNVRKYVPLNILSLSQYFLHLLSAVLAGGTFPGPTIAGMKVSFKTHTAQRQRVDR